MPLPAFPPLRHGKWRQSAWNEASHLFSGAKGFARAKEKPDICTGAGCPGRANPLPEGIRWKQHMKTKRKP